VLEGLEDDRFAAPRHAAHDQQGRAGYLVHGCFPRVVCGTAGGVGVQPKLPSRTGFSPRWWSLILPLCLTSRRSSLSASTSMAAYMSTPVASACRVRPGRVTVASALCFGLSMLSWVRISNGSSKWRDRRLSLVS